MGSLQTRNRKSDHLAAQSSRAPSHGAALLVLLVSLLGASTQLQAFIACTGVDGSGWYCVNVTEQEFQELFLGDNGGDGGTGGDETGFGGGGGSWDGAVRIGSILISASDWIKVAQAAGCLAELTVAWGKADIVRFQATSRLHVTSASYTLIPW